VPLGTYFGWNYRDPSVGAPEHLAGEIGSFIPFERTRAERARAGDPRRSIAERYPDKPAYLDRVRAAAAALVTQGYLLERDVPGIVDQAATLWDWASAGR